MLEFITKYGTMFMLVFTAIGGLSTVLFLLRALFPDWYKNKLSPWLKVAVPKLKSLDDVIDQILKSAPNNAVFKSLDSVVDYLLKELREAGYHADEVQVLQRLNDSGANGVVVKRDSEGWKIEYRREF